MTRETIPSGEEIINVMYITMATGTRLLLEVGTTNLFDPQTADNGIPIGKLEIKNGKNYLSQL